MRCFICGGKTPSGKSVCDACKTRLAPAPPQRLRPPSADQSREVARLLRLGECEAAEALCRQLLASSPRDAALLTFAGDIARAQGRLREAVESYTRALALRPRERMAVLKKLHAVQDALHQAGRPILELDALDEDAGHADDSLPATPAAPSVPAPDDAGDQDVELTPAASVLTPAASVRAPAASVCAPGAGRHADDASPLAELCTPRRLLLLASVILLVVASTILINWHPWRRPYRAPVHAAPLPLEAEGIPPAPAPNGEHSAVNLTMP